MIQAGGDVNEQTEYGSTSLHAASVNGHVEGVKSFIEAGGDINCRTEIGNTHTMPHIRRNPLVIRRKEIKTLQSAPPFLLLLL